MTMQDINVDYSTTIPNNVGLTEDRRVLKALEVWHPGYLNWWNDMGPEGFQEKLVYLRTAYSVDPRGWAKFDYVRMPEYRWGILLAPQEENRVVPFGEHYGEPAWQEVPGEHRAMLRRLIVIQGDTEPASVEQQRHLGKTAPSLYDMRNLFQVNVEEGRHLWAMVYLLQKYFGADGRDEAEGLLQRRSGDPDTPRMLGAFNEETPDWLSFFMFTFFTDRDGKMQLEALAQSGFDPLSRTCRFMLTEEAHHMFVGETGVGRIIERTCEAMKAAVPFELKLPSVAFNRKIGEFRDVHTDTAGRLLSNEAWEKRQGEFLPSSDDRDYVEDLMARTLQREPGKFASWISPPKVGIDNKPGDFEYVKI